LTFYPEFQNILLALKNLNKYVTIRVSGDLIRGGTIAKVGTNYVVLDGTERPFLEDERRLFIFPIKHIQGICITPEVWEALNK
jgi:signal transduction histidine kinase